MKNKQTQQRIALVCASLVLQAFRSVLILRKHLLPMVVFFMSAMTGFSQGNQTAVQIPVTESGRFLRWALLHTPDDYASTSTKYPLVVFLHGKGEQGTCVCPSDLAMIYNSSGAGGPSYFIARNQWPSSFTNPADGKAYKFIVLSPQAENGWSTSGLSLGFIIQYMIANYRVDTTRIYVTGISAGGQGVVDYVVHNSGTPTHKAAAFVPMSAVISPTYEQAENVVGDSVRALSFGDPVNDVHGTNTKKLIDSMNTVRSGSGRFINYSGGHCCWNTYYNPNWNDPVTGLSIWEWMLTQKREAAPMQTLPVNFISFNASLEENHIRLTWRVGEEENVSSYEIEKSNDGSSFTKIGSIDAAGHDEYGFIDHHIQSNNFYRIKSVDHDGKYKYSAIARADQARTSLAINAYPVPAQKEITIQHPLVKNNSRISIIAGDGKLIREKRTTRGAQQTVISLDDLHAGLYFIYYEDGEGNAETIKFMKQ